MPLTGNPLRRAYNSAPMMALRRQIPHVGKKLPSLPFVLPPASGISAPQEIADWGENANCYAYALGCQFPTLTKGLQTAVPGAAVGSAARPVPDSAAYVDALIQGVVADGHGAVRQTLGTPSSNPDVEPHEHLIALLSKPHGFHFIARDPVTGNWTWKDGNAESVKLAIYHVPSAAYVPVTDAVLNDLLSVRRQDFIWRYGGMEFRSIFAVDDRSPIQVAA